MVPHHAAKRRGRSPGRHRGVTNRPVSIGLRCAAVTASPDLQIRSRNDASPLPAGRPGCGLILRCGSTMLTPSVAVDVAEDVVGGLPNRRPGRAGLDPLTNAALSPFPRKVTVAVDDTRQSAGYGRILPISAVPTPKRWLASRSPPVGGGTRPESPGRRQSPSVVMLRAGLQVVGLEVVLGADT